MHRLGYLKDGAKQSGLQLGNQLLMNDSNRVQRGESRFNYFSEIDAEKQSNTNLHKEYVELYEKYSAAPSDDYPEQQKPAQKLNEKPSKRFIPFVEESQEDPLSKQILMENKQLKSKLQESQQMVHKLQVELDFCNQEMNKLKAIATHEEEVIKEMWQEISLILQNNKIMEEELVSLRTCVKNYSVNACLNETNLTNIEQKINRRTFNRNDRLSLPKEESLEHQKENISINYASNHSYVHSRRGYSRKQQNQRRITGSCELDGVQQKRMDELMQSIKAMYSKIMGMQSNSLKDLWKWLKNIGLIYSSLRKWKPRAREILNSKTIREQKLKLAISEAIDYITDP